MDEYQLLISKIPRYLNKYLEVSCLKRLKDIDYFCGMKYASKDIYNFKYDISRYDHSLSTALLTYYFKGDKEEVISALFHDVASPVFSHVIDYMNKDYINQESTEEKTEEILLKDKKLLTMLKKDKININNIIDFKSHSLVDLKRPMLCADRLDGILLSSLSWTKEIQISDIKYILNNLLLFINEKEKVEIGATKEVAEQLVRLEEKLNEYTHTKEDNYMMELLANITKYVIDKNYIDYDDLYRLKEMDMMKIFTYLSIYDSEFCELFNKFKEIRKEEIVLNDFPKIKSRTINPLINHGTRLY